MQAPISHAALSHTRKDCRICFSRDLVPALDFGVMPLAGGHPFPSELASEVFLPLRVMFCPRCALLQVPDVVRPEVLFGAYPYVTGTIPSLVKHFVDYAQRLAAIVPKSGLVVEFGCNDGVLLEAVSRVGLRGVGVDASENVLALARKRGVDVVHDLFGPDVARRIRDEHGPAAVVTGSNVFAHIDDVHALVEGALVLLDSGGRMIVEVHHVESTLKELQFDTIYHEHLCEYSLHSLDYLFRMHGMEVISCDILPMHAGSLRVCAARAGEIPPDESVKTVLEGERKLALSDAATWERFGRDSRSAAALLHAELQRRRDAGQRLSGYGASGRGATLLNYARIGKDLLDVVYDASPHRCGRVMPGVHIPVVPPAELRTGTPPAAVLLLAWNYEKDICATESWFLDQGGEMIVPLPAVRVVRGGRS